MSADGVFKLMGEILDKNGNRARDCSCGKPNACRCSRCKKVSYCGRDCQIKDWPDHKAVCVSDSEGGDEKKDGTSPVSENAKKLETYRKMIEVVREKYISVAND